MPIFDWNIDQAEILRRCSVQGTLKLCVKVLDEPSLIEGWIKHHAAIVGYENLVIADNGSTDARTLKVYENYHSSVTIFRFYGPHNEIHWHPRFRPLFEVIKQTSRYCALIDVDERLVWIDGKSWIADTTIVDRISSLTLSGIIPCTWLINTLNSFTTFSLLDTEGTPTFQNNLRWGKPILPVELLGVQDGIHNTQFDKYLFTVGLGLNLFLLHLTQFPDRRVAVNRNKLISRGIIKADATIEQIVGMNFGDTRDWSFIRLVDEIKSMIGLSNGRPSDLALPEHVRLSSDNRVHFSNKSAEEAFLSYIDNPERIISVALNGFVLKPSVFESPLAVLDLGKLLRQQGFGPKSEHVFRIGMRIFPDYVDEYGGPAFRKELLRTYLSRSDWSKAEELVPHDEDVDHGRWHQILFARAFDQVGDTEKAETWWKQVLRHEPENGEARLRLIHHLT